MNAIFERATLIAVRFLLRVLLVAVALRCPAECAEDKRLSINTARFYFSQKKLDFLRAQMFCLHHFGNARLLSPVDRNTRIAVTTPIGLHIDSDSIWIGLVKFVENSKDNISRTWLVNCKPRTGNEGGPNADPKLDTSSDPCTYATLSAGKTQRELTTLVPSDCKEKRSFVCEIRENGFPGEEKDCGTLLANGWYYSYRLKKMYKVLRGDGATGKSQSYYSEACKKEGALLSSIHSVEENNFVQYTLKMQSAIGENVAQEAWIGYSFRQGSREAFHEDRTPADYANWASGQPVNENCVQMTIDSAGEGKWKNSNCDTMLTGGICKRDLPEL